MIPDRTRPVLKPALGASDPRGMTMVDSPQPLPAATTTLAPARPTEGLSAVRGISLGLLLVLPFWIAVVTYVVTLLR